MEDQVRNLLKDTATGDNLERLVKLDEFTGGGVQRIVRESLSLLEERKVERRTYVVRANDFDVTQVLVEGRVDRRRALPARDETVTKPPRPRPRSRFKARKKPKGRR